MNLLKTLKAILSISSQGQREPREIKHSEFNQKNDYDPQTDITKHMATIFADAEALMKKYGTNFHSFFYRDNLDAFIRQEILPFKNPGSKYNDFFDHDHWMKKHSFNFPGPFYTGESDTCGTGDGLAPNNVMYDSYCCEYIFKQPQTFAEFLCVIDAANVEVFDSYSCNGNKHWTYQKCREWWKNKAQLIDELDTVEVRQTNGNRIQLYVDYLRTNAETDLKKYCYFLENGIYPNESEKLPLL